MNAHVNAHSGEIWIPSGYSNEKAAFDFEAIAKKAAQEKAEREAREAKELKEREARLAAERAKYEENLRKAQEAAKNASQNPAEVHKEPTVNTSIDMTLPEEILFEQISRRNDYENMTIEELQTAILAKMAKNGPLNEEMRRTVSENVYHNSLLNWVKSFR